MPLSYFREPVTTARESDMRRLLKSLDDKLKSQPSHFWNYICNLKWKEIITFNFRFMIMQLTGSETNAEAGRL